MKYSVVKRPKNRRLSRWAVVEEGPEGRVWSFGLKRDAEHWIAFCEEEDRREADRRCKIPLDC